VSGAPAKARYGVGRNTLALFPMIKSLAIERSFFRSATRLVDLNIDGLVFDWRFLHNLAFSDRRRELWKRRKVDDPLQRVSLKR
jgi:hypothetical protein